MSAWRRERGVEAQAAGSLAQVAFGRQPRARRIAVADGLEHGDVFVVHGIRHAGQLAAVGARGADSQAQLQIQVLQQVLVERIVGRGRDRQVEGDVVFDSMFRMVLVPFQVGQGASQGVQVGGVAALGRQRGGAAFEFHAQFVDAGKLFAADGDVDRHLEALRTGARQHHATRPLAALDQALGAQALGDFADDGGADAVLLGQDAAGRQLGAHGIDAMGDVVRDLAGDLFGEGQALGQHRGEV